MKRANSGLTWIRQDHVRQLLLSIGSVSTPVSHELLDSFEPSRSVEFVRGLLVEHDVLPHRDRLSAEFDRWVADRPAMLHDAAARPVFAQYIRWHQKRRLRRATGPDGRTPRGVFLSAKQTTTVAIQFLNWLAERDTALANVDQHNIDAWFGTGPSTREHAVDLLYWVQQHRHMPTVDLPRRDKLHANPLGIDGRLALVRRVLTDDDTAMTVRMAAGIILLFGQQINRTVTLRLDAIRAAESGDLEIRFSQDWVPVPTVFAVLLDGWITARPNLQTASHRESPWLFPGTMPGEHLVAGTVSTLLAQNGISARAAREAAWQDLVRAVPPPLLASAFGVAPHTLDDYAKRAATRFSRYAAIPRSG